MTRPYVNHVTSSIQGGVDLPIGQKTLIVAPNAVGKSTIIRAIELATTGRASDIAGRETLALDAELWTLAPAGVDTVAATVAFSDARSATWDLSRGRKAKRGGPSAVFPLRTLRDALAGNAETARKFFLAQIGSDFTWDRVLSEIPEVFRPRLDPFKNAATGAAGLTSAVESLKKRARDLRAEAKAARSLAEKGAVGLAPPPSAADLEAAKAVEAGVAAAWALARRSTITDEIRSAEARIAVAQDRIKTGQAALQANPVDPLVPKVIDVLMALVRDSASTCGVCGSAVGAAALAARLNAARARVDQIRAAEEATRRTAEYLAGARFDAGAAEADLKRLRTEAADLDRKIATLPAVAGAAPRETYAVLIARDAAWKQIRTAEATAITKEREANDVDQIVEACQTALARVLATSIDAFVARVQSFLPSSFVFGMTLRDGDREVLRIGLRDLPPENDESGDPPFLRTPLSGAEWATVTSAIAAAISASLPPTEPVIIVPEDRDLDPVTLADVMRAWSSFDGQVIIAGTKFPVGEIPGWTVIRLTSPDVAVIDAPELNDLSSFFGG